VYKVGLIRVVTQQPPLLEAHADILKKAYPMLDITSRCIEGQSDGVHDKESENLAIPKIISLARQFYEDGMEAVIISCAGDPALDVLRADLPIPVIGAGRSCASAAAGSKGLIGVIGITEGAPPAFREILGDRIVDDTLPEGVICTLDLLTEKGRQSVLARAMSQKQMGAEAIAFACTGLSTIGIAPYIEESVGVPVFDAVLCEGAFACLALSNHVYKE